MRASKRRGFGLIESLLSLFLVGIVLGLVARGYQALNRLSQASYEMSQRLELGAFVRRMGYELSTAQTVEVDAVSASMTRTDPGLNLARNEARDRLPWPIPDPRPTAADLASHRVTVVYSFDSAAKQITRTQGTQSSVVGFNIGAFQASLAANNKLLTIEVRPGNMTSAVKTTVYLPAVEP